jgi:hypothetical protein
MTTLHTLGILSTSFTWNTFPTVLKEFPHAEHFPSLCGTTHPKPSQLGCGRVIVETSSSDAALSFLVEYPLHSLEMCWVIVLLKNDSPTKPRPDGMLQNAVVAMLVKYALNSK